MPFVFRSALISLFVLSCLTGSGCYLSSEPGTERPDVPVLPTLPRELSTDDPFVGYADESEQAVIELTHNWDTKSYELGNAFGHIALGMPDVYKACEAVKAKGGKVTREPGPMKFGGSVIAFVEDPDGYKIEFIQKAA